MKKFLAIVLSIIMVFSLCACGNNEKAEKYCSSCGEGISKDTAFCEHCGPTVNNEKAESEDNSSDNSSSTESKTEETSKPSSATESTSIPTESSKPSTSNKPSSSTTQSTSKPSSSTENTSKPSTPTHTHSYSKKVTAATCTEKGYTTHTCKVCGDTYTDSNKKATGHSWGSWVTVSAATVEKAGQEKRTCSVCKTKETRTIPALEDNTPTETISIQFPQTPLYVNTIKLNMNTGKYGVSHTIKINEFYYEIDSFGHLHIYCKGEKTYDIKGANSTYFCEMKWRLYDADGYLIDSGWDSVGSLKVGDKFKDHKINVSPIRVTPGTSYRLEIFDSSYE